MEWRYKPGDKVQVIGNIQEGMEYYMHSGPNVYSPTQNKYGIIVRSMTFKQRKMLEGEIVTIKSRDSNRYLIEETNERTFWTDDMFLGPAGQDECFCMSLL